LNVAHKTGHINENKREKKRNSVIWNLFECRKVFLEVSKYKLCNSKIQSQCMPFKKIKWKLFIWQTFYCVGMNWKDGKFTVVVVANVLIVLVKGKVSAK